MTKQITREQVFIAMHSGYEVWIDKEKQAGVESQLADPSIRFVKLEGRLLNANSVGGIFLPGDATNLAHKKSGAWQCQYGEWHGKKEQCGCAEIKRYGL